MNRSPMKKPSSVVGRELGQQATSQKQPAEWKYKPTAKPVAISNEDFLVFAFCKCGADEYPWVTGFPGDPGSIAHRMWGGRIAFPLPFFITGSSNNYVAVSTFQALQGDRVKRSKQCFAGMYTVMVDDVGTKIRFDKLGLEPTCLVQTSPGNFQAWYFLTEPERDRHRAEQLVNGMIAAGLTADGSDPGMKGVTRYGRLPVGINGKAKYHDAQGKPFIQTVNHWNPVARYTIEQIANAFGVDMTSKPKAPPHRATRRVKPGAAFGTTDGFVDVLEKAGLYLEPLAGIEGGHHIICPWVHEHTDEDPTGTVYFEPSEANNQSGGFKCHHGHCQHRTMADLNHFVIRLMQLNKEFHNV